MVEIFNIFMSAKRKRNSNTKLNVTIIPHLSKANEISLTRGDTLLVEIDPEYIDLNSIPQILSAFEKQFPENSIMIIFNSMKVTKVKEIL